MQNLSELVRRLVVGNAEFVPDRDTLITAKNAVGRDHDRITVKQLKEIKKQQNPI